MKRFLAFLMLLVMVVLVGTANAEGGKYIVNTQRDPLNVRDEPGGAVFSKLKKGTVVEVKSFTHGWAEIWGESMGYVWAEYLAPYSGDGISTERHDHVLEKASTAGTTIMYVKKSMGGWLNVRAGESVKSDFLGKLYAGDKVYVAEDKGEWLKIAYKGYYAYVMASFIEKSNSSATPEVMPSAVGTYKVIGGRLNVRKGPSLKDGLLDRLECGSTVRLIEDMGEWCKVYYRGDRIGYVMKQFITAK